jgi:hypothetical protein
MWIATMVALYVADYCIPAKNAGADELDFAADSSVADPTRKLVASKDFVRRAPDAFQASALDRSIIAIDPWGWA